MRNFDTFRFDADKVAVEISKNLNKIEYYETDTNINVEYVNYAFLYGDGKYCISLDETVPRTIAKMIATSLRCYAGGTTELVDVEHAEDDGHHYAIIWSI